MEGFELGSTPGSMECCCWCPIVSLLLHRLTPPVLLASSSISVVTFPPPAWCIFVGETRAAGLTISVVNNLEYSQGVGQHFCDNTHYVLNYTVLTKHSGGNETLVLTAQNVPVSGFPDPESITTNAIMRLPLYLNITLLGCPPCFQFSAVVCALSSFNGCLQ